MSKRKNEPRIVSVFQEGTQSTATSRRGRKPWLVIAAALMLLMAVGVFARNGWFPSTDALTGKKTGWFGSRSEPGAVRGPREGIPSGVQDATGFFASAPLPTPTPQLSREYIYAGGSSRLLAIEDANANAAPPADLAVWRPSDGGWWVMGGEGSQQVMQNWGASGDEPVEGDFDGDGKTDFSVFRASTGIWYLIYSSTSTTAQFPFGSSSDVPAQADYS